MGASCEMRSVLFLLFVVELCRVYSLSVFLKSICVLWFPHVLPGAPLIPRLCHIVPKLKQIRFSYSQTGLEWYEGKSKFSQVPNSGPTYQREGCMSFKILGWDRAVLRDQHASTRPACMKEKCSEHKLNLSHHTPKIPLSYFRHIELQGLNFVELNTSRKIWRINRRV